MITTFNFGSKIQRRSISGGFTIVETLVAITVLMIAVAGPLVVATKGLNKALISKNQTIAFYLAQDTMETIKNVRDQNIFSDPTGATWLNGIGGGASCDSSSNTCDVNGIDVDSNNLPKTVTCTQAVAPHTCLIYFNPNSGYSHANNNGSLTESGFRRAFYLEDKGSNNGHAEKVAHVIVDWYEGTVPYQIHLTSQLLATQR